MARLMSWVASRMEPARLLERLTLRATGEVAASPAEAPLCGVTLESGWSVVFAHGDLRFVNRAWLEDASFDDELVAVAIDERTWVSQAVCYAHSQLKWAVVHDGSVGRTHALLEGAAPRQAHELVAAARANKKPFVDHVFAVPELLFDTLANAKALGAERYGILAATEVPWRAFRHADGRAWAARVTASGYELRIEVEGDEPMVKARASGRPFRDVEALIAEQVADGFSAAS
jgi:hypothetical protein